MSLLRPALLAVAITISAHALLAQQHLNVPREDGHSTPLLVYAPSPKPAGCAPLAILSHGAGGSENGLSYLALSLSQFGYTAIVMGHRESGFDAVRASIASQGRQPGIQAVVADPTAESDRLLDVTAALKWADTQCKAPFKVLLGHSMGAETVLLEAGARNILNIGPAIAGRNRFDAYIPLSPEGPGPVFPEHAFNDIHKPVLSLTGTRDGALHGGPASRLVAWSELPGMPGHCQWQGVVTGATHADMGGNGPSIERVEPLVTAAVASFLKGVRSGACTLLSPQPGFTLQAK